MKRISFMHGYHDISLHDNVHVSLPLSIMHHDMDSTIMHDPNCHALFNAT